MKQNGEDQIWDMVEEFYKSMAFYLTQYNAYNQKLLEFNRKENLSQNNLPLNVEGFSSLLDFKKLEELRNNHLWPLKELSHSCFRTPSSTDSFDRYVSDIFHEVSILKEQQYKVKIYAPAYLGMKDNEEAASIIEEVNVFFPVKMLHIYTLFQKAKKRLEELLPTFKDNTVFIRSLYLYGEEIVSPVYNGSTDNFYKKMYPDGGKIEAYFNVAISFQKSYFFEYAKNTVQRALGNLNNEQSESNEWVIKLKDVMKGLG